MSDEDLLVKSVVDFTGATSPRARELLEESNWHVPEAVTRFFAQVDVAPNMAETRARPRIEQQGVEGEKLMNFFTSFMRSIKQCFGWAAYSCWSACKFFLFGGSIERSGNMGSFFPALSPLLGTFPEATKLCRRKVLLIYLNSKSAQNLDSVNSILIEGAIGEMIKEQFAFWPGDTDFVQPSQLLHVFKIRTIPALVAVIPVNASELKLVAVCTNITVDSVMSFLGKAQEAQDGILAEDEQFRMNRDLREVQDREYQEALERDAKVEEEKEKIEMKKNEKLNRISNSNREKKQLMNKFLDEEGDCMIVVKLPNGARITRKFLSIAEVSIIYDWVLCCGIMYPDTCAELGEKMHRDNFVLSTSFPSKKLTSMDISLSAAELVPNAVLVFNLLEDDDSE